MSIVLNATKVLITKDVVEATNLYMIEPLIAWMYIELRYGMIPFEIGT